jgi:hypothetical protein
MLNEKSVSRTQQRLFGQAYGVRMWQKTEGSQNRKGINPKDLDPKYKKEIMLLAKSMSLAKLKEFAQTKHKDLPEEVKEGIIKTIYSKLSPEAEYDPSRKKQRSMANLADYREHIKKNKN